MSVRAGGQEFGEAWLAGACSAAAGASGVRAAAWEAWMIRCVMAGEALAVDAVDGSTADAIGS